MANTYKILGQINPAGGVETVLYTVPAATNAIISCITICNFNNPPSSVSNNSGKFTISVSKTGATTTNKDIIYNLVNILQGDTYIANVGITLSAGDVIRVYSSVETLSFNLFGTEIT
jgi:hypothetical protein